jgi:hypothetical protein
LINVFLSGNLLRFSLATICQEKLFFGGKVRKLRFAATFPCGEPDGKKVINV